jgi:inosine-uridine nucleoside N-ribohydrolase
MPDAPARIPLIIDCDTGIDDSLALLYACASPEAEIVAVTCVAGNVDARQVAENTRAVLELAGRDDVEVALGREVPLARDLVTTPETHGPRGIGYAELPPARRALSSRHAVDLLIDKIRNRPGEVTLVTLGPLTDVALAALRQPELPRLLRRLVIMGGSYRSPGNTAPTSEWNVHVDPEAARIVFNAFGAPDVVAAREAAGLPGRPLALGLDVTERAKLTPDHLERLAARAGCRPDGSVASGDSGGSGGRAAGLPPLPLALGLDVTERAKLTPDRLEALAARAGAGSVAFEGRVERGGERQRIVDERAVEAVEAAVELHVEAQRVGDEADDGIRGDRTRFHGELAAVGEGGRVPRSRVVRAAAGAAREADHVLRRELRAFGHVQAQRDRARHAGDTAERRQDDLRRIGIDADVPLRRRRRVAG